MRERNDISVKKTVAKKAQVRKEGDTQGIFAVFLDGEPWSGPGRLTLSQVTEDAKTAMDTEGANEAQILRVVRVLSRTEIKVTDH